MKGESKWDDRKADIQRLVLEDELNDTEIGLVYGVSGATIYHVRKRLGIASLFQVTGKKAVSQLAALEPVVEPLVGEPFVDEQGRPAKRYPARYAEGCLVESFTVKPRR